MCSARLFSRANCFEAALAFTGQNTSFAVGMTTLILIVLFFAIEWMQEQGIFSPSSQIQLSWTYAALTTVALCQCVVMFGILRSSAFIYFQF
jgi:hypothetical protein